MPDPELVTPVECANRQWFSGETWLCERERGHQGLHRATFTGGVTLRWPTVVERCDVSYLLGSRAHTCSKERGHDGEHRATVTTGIPPADIIWPTA